ncbi:MAG: tetratricopeptide repeat protein, partial [Elusimicrobiota bacterium]
EKYNEALRYYVAVTVVNKDNPEANKKIELIKKKLAEIERRKEQTERIRRQQSLERKVEEYYKNGMRSYENDDYEQSLVEFKKAIGYAIRLGDEGWREKLNEAVERTKNKIAENHYEKGYSYYQKNELKQAVEEFQKVLYYDPENEGAANKIKEIKKKMEEINRKEAEKLYNEAIKQYNAGNKEKAVELWKKVLEYNPDHKETLKALERIRATEFE